MTSSGRDTYAFFDYFKQLSPDKLRELGEEKQSELYYLNTNEDWEYRDHRISHLKDDIAVIDAILEGKLNGHR